MRGDLWRTYKMQKTLTSSSLSYTSNFDRQGSYDDPILDITGAWSRNFRMEDWSATVSNKGALLADHPPIVTAYGQSFSDAHVDGGAMVGRYTATETKTQNYVALWNILGRAEAQINESFSWSSDNSPRLAANDGAVWGTPTIIYGGGSYDVPLQHPDGSMSASYTKTDMTNNYELTDMNRIGRGKGTVRSYGSSWQFDGSVPNPQLTDMGYTGTVSVRVNSGPTCGRSARCRN